ncbi:hypothetical protein Y1Q_0000436 [Alligator mississippiensis]|uniref:Uncharacterized protein n=1 Tax=Alligator mississippiensis TaxID=8496 RepID=A0A151MB10_ALLMI|nr:hypothetical protein Y1Q_0000436 [Alligator mississippiensis]
MAMATWFSRVKGGHMVMSWHTTGHGGEPLSSNVHESGPMQAEGLDSLFVISSVHDDPLPMVTAGGMGLEPALNGLKVGPEHPSFHGILGGLVLIGHVEIDGPVQDVWRAQCGVADPKWDG